MGVFTCMCVCVIVLFVQCFFNYQSVISTPSSQYTKRFSEQFSCRLRCGKQSRCVTRSADGKGSHITVCVNAYVTRMLPTSLCGMTH